MPSVTESPSLPDLPVDWVPEDDAIVVFGRRVDGRWEAVIPNYSIVAQGDSLDDALHQGAELLEDYFRLCVRDGLTFRQARRPIRTRWLLQLIAGALLTAIVRRLPRLPKPRSGTRVLRVPSRHAFC